MCVSISPKLPLDSLGIMLCVKGGGRGGRSTDPYALLDWCLDSPGSTPQTCSGKHRGISRKEGCEYGAGSKLELFIARLCGMVRSSGDVWSGFKVGTLLAAVDFSGEIDNPEPMIGLRFVSQRGNGEEHVVWLATRDRLARLSGNRLKAIICKVCTTMNGMSNEASAGPPFEMEYW